MIRADIQNHAPARYEARELINESAKAIAEPGLIIMIEPRKCLAQRAEIVTREWKNSIHGHSVSGPRYGGRGAWYCHQ